MRKRIIGFLAMILAVIMTVGAAGITSFAADGTAELPELGSKVAVPLDKDGEYEITVSVPGAKSAGYNEVIIMLDASTSVSKYFDGVKDTVRAMGEALLNGKGTTRITLMGFGFSPKTAMTVTTVEELDASLASLTQNDLLYGRSATNCETAFTHILEYVGASPDLKDACVIFVSDGETNLDDHPIDWTKWSENTSWFYRGFTLDDILAYVAGAQADYLAQRHGEPLPATAEHYPDECASIAAAKQTAVENGDWTEYANAVDALHSAIIGGDTLGWVNAIWSDVFAEAGMFFVPGELYSCSQVETAFTDYFGNHTASDNENGDFAASFCDMFYLPIMYIESSCPDADGAGIRASAAADALCAADKVDSLYLVDVNSDAASLWMNPESAAEVKVTAENAEYITSTGVSAALEELKALGSELSKTDYNNVTVSDPMSKWVNMDPNTIRIYDGDTLIYQYNEDTAVERWKIADGRPTAADPITVEKDGATGLYRITWRIKDGALLLSDDYSMKYVVTVNREADGFNPSEQYPANDRTTATYEDENGDEVEAEIDVPYVRASEDLILNIHKYTPSAASDLPGDGTETDLDRTPIEGINFEIYYVGSLADIANGSLTVSKTPTAQEIAAYKTSDRLVATVTTDKDGLASYNFTENGREEESVYLIVELDDVRVTEAVDPFFVFMPMPDPDGTGYLRTVNVYPKNDFAIGGINILKHKTGNEEIVLAGATFKLAREASASELADDSIVKETLDGKQVVYVDFYTSESLIGDKVGEITTDENGRARLYGLICGEYYLVETAAPKGYNKLTDPIRVTVDQTSHLDENAVKVANSMGIILPSTGGVGTVVFTVVGSALAVGAATLLVIRKKRSRAAD